MIVSLILVSPGFEPRALCVLDNLYTEVNLNLMSSVTMSLKSRVPFVALGR